MQTADVLRRLGGLSGSVNRSEAQRSTTGWATGISQSSANLIPTHMSPSKRFYGKATLTPHPNVLPPSQLSSLTAGNLSFP